MLRFNLLFNTLLQENIVKENEDKLYPLYGISAHLKELLA